jgi:NTP pyrophosphatase (non-canonical NTP hydrolase)
MSDDYLEDLALRLKKFATARDWEKFHNPKNLAMALGVEVAELTEIFQWLSPEESESVMSDSKLEMAVKDELADIMIYLVRLASVLGVDLLAVANGKIDRNETRFPTRE